MGQRLLICCIFAAVTMLLAGCATNSGDKFYTGTYGGLSGGAAQGR